MQSPSRAAAAGSGCPSSCTCARSSRTRRRLPHHNLTAPVFEPDARDRAILLRATEHLRNLGHRGELLTLRDRLIGTGNARWIAYRLRFLDARPVQEFTSYSLAYGVGDRLVTPGKDELRVVGLAGRGPPELVVDELRRGQ